MQHCQIVICGLPEHFPRGQHRIESGPEQFGRAVRTDAAPVDGPAVFAQPERGLKSIAFDAAGNRMGRGRGFYDRLLPQLPHALKAGVCFDCQKLPSVPTDDYDIKMDFVI